MQAARRVRLSDHQQHINRTAAPNAMFGIHHFEGLLKFPDSSLLTLNKELLLVTNPITQACCGIYLLLQLRGSCPNSCAHVPTDPQDGRPQRTAGASPITPPTWLAGLPDSRQQL